MELVINAPAEIVVEVRKLELKVDVKKLPPVALSAIFDYGMGRILNDACGKAGKKPVQAEGQTDEAYADSVRRWQEACRDIARDKLDRLYAGEVDGRGGAAAVDPVREEMVKIARTVLKAKGQLPGAPKDAAQAIKDLIDGPSGAKIRAKAEAMIAEREKLLAELDI